MAERQVTIGIHSGGEENANQFDCSLLFTYVIVLYFSTVTLFPFIKETLEDTVGLAVLT